MYTKQLHKTAWASTPIFALFELSAIFMLTQYPNTIALFVLSFLITLTSVFMVWRVNIYIFSTIDSKRKLKKWKLYFFSYSFLALFSCLIIAILFFYSIQKEVLALFYYAVSIFCLNGIILMIINIIILQHKNVQTENELTSLKIENLEAQQEQLIKQLQPHFLFNALSTLKSLIKIDSDLAEVYLVKLSDFLRVSISSHNNKIITLSEELQFTNNYIELQRIRFADSFFCQVTIPENIMFKYQVAIYALQTLVENAIKHNAFTEENHLYVRIMYEEDKLVVSNNKIPKPLEVGGGMGLQNLNKRCLLLFGEGIHVQDTDDTFEVTIKLIEKRISC